jgi:hypothetical protein
MVGHQAYTLATLGPRLGQGPGSIPGAGTRLSKHNGCASLS